VERCDAIVVVSFGGPEGPEQVVPFLEHVTAGRPITAARLAEVEATYRRFGGVSPINAQNRALVGALEAELGRHGPALPVYWGNLHAAPWLEDAVRAMASDGVARALAWVTSAYPSPSGCRNYLDAIAAARAAVGDAAPEVDKIRTFSDHPGFVEPWAQALRRARGEAGPEAALLFSAHSIPAAQAQTCRYQARLLETAGLVAERAGEPSPRWELVFQSRSGRPDQAWLEPDLGERLAAIGAASAPAAVVVAPIGFVSDHMEVVYDIDVKAARTAAAAGLRLVRVPTPGAHPRFVSMIRELINERLDPSSPRLALGALGPSPDHCAANCCGPPPDDRTPPGQ